MRDYRGFFRDGGIPRGFCPLPTATTTSTRGSVYSLYKRRVVSRERASAVSVDCDAQRRTRARRAASRAPDRSRPTRNGRRPPRRRPRSQRRSVAAVAETFAASGPPVGVARRGAAPGSSPALLQYTVVQHGAFTSSPVAGGGSVLRVVVYGAEVHVHRRREVDAERTRVVRRRSQHVRRRHAPRGGGRRRGRRRRS